MISKDQQSRWLDLLAATIDGASMGAGIVPIEMAVKGMHLVNTDPLTLGAGATLTLSSSGVALVSMPCPGGALAAGQVVVRF